MHPYLIVITATVVFLFVVIWLIYSENQRQRNRNLEKFRERFGTSVEAEHSTEDMERIARASRQRQGQSQGYVDDITWSDLEMDTIFSRINQTLSTPGEEYLYGILRSPKRSKDELTHLDELADFFLRERDHREAMQLALTTVGKDRRFSLGDVVAALQDAPEIQVGTHWGLAIALLAALASLPFFPVAAVFTVFALVGVNAFTYQAGADRKKTEKYRYLFASLCRMSQMGRRLEGIAWPETHANCQAIADIRRRLRKFERKALWFSGRQATGGGFLDLFLDYLKMLFHVDLLIYPSLLRESQTHQRDFQALLDQIGELDAAISIGSFRASLPWYCKPTLRTGLEYTLRAEQLYHPLLERPVANDIDTKGAVLLTGSNASGKSTFLKAVAVNGILAQTLYTCTAKTYEGNFCQVYSSIALRDSIQDGESYFMAEIRSLKRILDKATENWSILCVVDEVLRGTNTTERIAASSRILGALAQPTVCCFAATHDLELTWILGKIYENYHFEETVEGEDIQFHYQLKKGPSTTRNALRLLELTGYDTSVVRAARQAAEKFQRTGLWETMGGGEGCK